MSLALEVEPEFDADFGAVVFGRKRVERAGILDGAQGGGVDGIVVAGLRDLRVDDLAIAKNVEGDDDARSGDDGGIDSGLQPVAADALLNGLDVPGETRAEIAASYAGEAQAALRIAGAQCERSGGNRGSAAVAVGDGVGRRRSGIF